MKGRQSDIQVEMCESETKMHLLCLVCIPHHVFLSFQLETLGLKVIRQQTDEQFESHISTLGHKKQTELLGNLRNTKSNNLNSFTTSSKVKSTLEDVQSVYHCLQSVDTSMNVITEGLSQDAKHSRTRKTEKSLDKVKNISCSEAHNIILK